MNLAREIKEGIDARAAEDAGAGAEPVSKKIRFSAAGKASVSSTAESILLAEQEVYFGVDDVSRARERKSCGAYGLGGVEGRLPTNADNQSDCSRTPAYAAHSDCIRTHL